MCAIGKCLLYILFGLYAATEINNERRCLGDSAEHVNIDDVLRLGTVEIHDMQTLEPSFLEMPCHFHGVVSIYGLAVIVAFSQTHAFTVNNIYSRYKFYHTFSISMKF